MEGLEAARPGSRRRWLWWDPGAEGTEGFRWPRRVWKEAEGTGWVFRNPRGRSASAVCPLWYQLQGCGAW